jgi:opacity protein-like surface antigen
LVVACLLGWSPIAAAGGHTWGLIPGEGVNVHPDFVNVALVLLEQHLVEQGVTVIRGTAESNPQDFLSQGADGWVRFSIVRMGETAKVTLQAFGADGMPTGACSMTAGSPDDMDNVAARLVRSILTGKGSREGETIYDVTEQEQEQLKKKRSTMYYGLKINGVTAFTSPLSEEPLKYGFGFYGLYDPRIFLAELWTNFTFGSGDGFSEFSWELGVSGYYPFSETNFCPYVGGGLAMATRTATVAADDPDGSWDNEADSTWSGLSVSAAAGVLFGRTSDVLLRAELRFFADTFKVAGDPSTGLMYTMSIGY